MRRAQKHTSSIPSYARSFRNLVNREPQAIGYYRRPKLDLFNIEATDAEILRAILRARSFYLPNCETDAEIVEWPGTARPMCSCTVIPGLREPTSSSGVQFNSMDASVVEEGHST